MAAQNRRRGCGCCGCFFASFLSLFALSLVGVGFFYFSPANNLKRIVATGQGSLPVATFNRQIYVAARQKLDQFFADQAKRNVTFSNSEINALLADSPELRILRRGAAVVLNQDSAEVVCNLPVDFPLLPRRYLNFAFHVRPSMRGDELGLDISRIESEGKFLGVAESRQYQLVVAPVVEKLLSSLNRIQGSRSVHDVQIENGNLVLTH